MLQKTALFLTVGLLFAWAVSYGQSIDSTANKLIEFPSRFLSKVQSKAGDLNKQLARQTDTYIQRMAREESRLRRKLERKDSAAANRIFGSSAASYQALQQKLNSSGSVGQLYHNVYNSHLDSLKTAIAFLRQKNSGLAAGVSSPELQTKVTSAMSNLDEFQGKLNQSEEVKSFLSDRQAYLQQQLGKFGMTSSLDRFKTTAYYYKAQVDEYSQTFKDPSRIEAKAMQILAGSQLYRNFFNQHSELAGLFRLPGADELAASSGALPGLQTRDMTSQDLLQRFGTVPNVQQTLQQNMGEAQSRISQLKDKVSQVGSGSGGNGNADMPDFNPNGQKTRTFLQRLEYGTNLQTTKNTAYFPVTSDLALSVGYKISDKSIIGIGASYKIGWGSDISHINISSQGIGLRSFIDIKLKGNIWISGGGELNYESGFNSIKILEDYSPWQKSVLLGLSKKYNIGKKLNGNIQVLYDFLYKQQIPNTQPFVFRVGYSFQ